jgi:hypothetical protein
MAGVAWAGPVEFGKQELERALTGRKLSPQWFRVVTEVTTDPPESFRILPGQVSGGDVRGLMYGLLEAAEQIRQRGQLLPAKGAPAMPIRGVRLFIRPEDVEGDWYNAREFWQRYSEMLARSRFNRLDLVFSGLDPGERTLATLRTISQTAAEYAIDLTLGLRLPADEPGADRVLKRVLAACPAIRSVQVWYGDQLFRPIGEAGRRVTLELRNEGLTPGLLKVATEAGLPLRISVTYGESEIELPARPLSSQLMWVVSTADPSKRMLWSDPDFVRRTVSALAQPGYSGFEIDPPLPPDSEDAGLFYSLWGRLSYDPKTPASVWGKELKRP